MNRGAIAGLAVAAAASVALAWVPELGMFARPLSWTYALVHELGHALTALALGQTVRGVAVFADGSGVASWAGDGSRLVRAAVAAGGLVAPAVAAALGFRAGRSVRGARWALGVSGVVLLLVAVLFADSTLAFGLCLGLGALALWLARMGGESARGVLLFLSVQLALGVFSRADYLFTPTARTARGEMPSDVGQIAAALWLPWWLWGALLALASVGVLVMGLRGLLRGR